MLLCLKEKLSKSFKFLSLDVTASQSALVLLSTKSRFRLDILGTFSLVGKLSHS